MRQLNSLCEQQASLKKLLADCEPNWTALRKALEEEDDNLRGEWGERPLPKVVPPTRAEDVIRRHEEQNDKAGLLMDKGAASTTKKIVQSSIMSRKKMAGFDDALK